VIGTSVGPYQVLARLGAGGMGEVFLGHDTRLQRRVALKRLTGIVDSGEAERRIFREARAIARLTHPNIAAIYDVLDEGAGAFIVMEYVEGESLAARLRRGPLAPDEVRAITRQLAAALAAAHAQGIVHRDLKPANIHITPTGAIKVLDFGIAKLAAPAADAAADTTDRPAGEETLGGTPGTPIYMSPEQLFGLEVDGRSDIYSAGVIAFEMATGRRPFEETNAAALAFATRTRRAPAAASLNPLVPLDLSEAIAKALEPAPARRFQTADEFERALASPAPTTASRTAILARLTGVARSRPLVAAAVAGVLLALVAIGVARGPLARRLPWLRGAAPAATPALLVLPVDNATGDLPTAYLGDAIATNVATALRTAGGVTLVPRKVAAPFAVKRTDYPRIRQQASADYVLDITMTSAGSSPAAIVRVQSTIDAARAVRQTLSGPPVQIEQRAIEAVVSVLPGSGRRSVLQRATRSIPTGNDEAVLLLAGARALLDRADLAANVDRAIDRLQRAVDLDPQFVPGYAALGAVLVGRYERTRDSRVLDRAREVIAAALERNPDSSAARYAFGYLQYATGARDSAAAALHRAIALDPDNDDAHRVLGWRVFVSQGRMNDAIAEVGEAVRIRPESFENHYRMGNVLYMAGRYNEAIEAYRKATELQPARADVFTNLGATYWKLGDVTQATGNYEHAVRTGAGDALAYGNLAIAYYVAGRYREALAACLEAIARDPQRASYQRDLGDYLTKLGRQADARVAYLKAIELAGRTLASNSRDAITIVLVAICEAHLGDRSAAERHVAEALALAPTDLEVLFRSAKTYAILGDRAAALVRLRMAVERGYPASLARTDPELAPLKSSEFENAINAGLQARSRAGAVH
jgi:tetratricopeptide (TPR) repeat protein/TolB-like protein